MRISHISNVNINNLNNYTSTPLKSNPNITVEPEQKQYAKIPRGFTFGANIEMSDILDIMNKCTDEYTKDGRKFPFINRFNYLGLSQEEKHRLNKYCDNFTKKIDTSKLFSEQFTSIPLRNEAVMDDFLRVSSLYNKYKDNPIICLGRSPKWFLNASLWMKDGIKDYTFIPFSSSWYRYNDEEGLYRYDRLAPTEEQEKNYRELLLKKKIDPKTIVDHFKKTGKKTIITDYINTSKGATSFMEVMGNFAIDQGIPIKEFAKAIKFVSISSLDYMDTLKRFADEDTVSTPELIMPVNMVNCEKELEQEYFNMSEDTMWQVLQNRNANECRSTFYPCMLWDKIKDPDNIMFGYENDFSNYIQKILDDVNKFKPTNERKFGKYTPEMLDYRNALTFTILQGIEKRGLLKTTFKSSTNFV